MPDRRRRVCLVVFFLFLSGCTRVGQQPATVTTIVTQSSSASPIASVPPSTGVNGEGFAGTGEAFKAVAARWKEIADVLERFRRWPEIFTTFACNTAEKDPACAVIAEVQKDAQKRAAIGALVQKATEEVARLRATISDEELILAQSDSLQVSDPSPRSVDARTRREPTPRMEFRVSSVLGATTRTLRKIVGHEVGHLVETVQDRAPYGPFASGEEMLDYFGLVFAFLAEADKSGTADATFGEAGASRVAGGMIEAWGGMGSQIVARQVDGKFYVVGNRIEGGKVDFAVARFSSEGVLDTSWGTTGIIRTGVGSNMETARAVAIQPDGKIVVVGASVNPSVGGMGCIAVRYTTAGKLDTTFNKTGIVRGATGSANCYAVALQPNGKIMALGSMTASDGRGMLYAVRWDTFGVPDMTFGGNGERGFMTGQSVAQEGGVFLGATVGGDGKVVASGYISRNGGAFAVVARFLPDGGLDTTFGTNGVATVRPGGSFDAAIGVGVQDDGGIVVTGWSNDGASTFNAFLVRFDATGTVDTTFGKGGVVIASWAGGIHQDLGNHVAFQNDGKILVTGYSRYANDRSAFSVARFNHDGSFDTNFAKDGVATKSYGKGRDYPMTLHVQADGRIVVAGYAANGSGFDFVLLRYWQ